MYTVWINHFLRNGNVVDVGEVMLSVPSSEKFAVDKPIVKANEDSAENFTFSMESNSPYYDALLPLKTRFRVDYDGEVIFYGRVLTISKSSVFQTKNVTCEGKYAFLNDTYYEGKQEKFRGKITVSQYLDRIISNHNTMAPDKTFVRGTVGVTLPSEQDKYEPTSWTQTSSLISNLTSNYGGHIRIRHGGNALATAYIDWYKYYARDLGDGLRPSVVVGKNILDISSEDSIDNIFTRVIPIGDTNSEGKTIYLDGYKYTDKNGTRHTYSGKSMSVSFIRDLYTDGQLTDEFHDYKDYRDAETNYGIIYKTMSFSDADTQQKLFNNVKKWIKESYFGLVTSFTVKAVDFHITDGTLPKILLGDCVDVTYLIVINGVSTWVTKKLVCKSATYDLFNPENNTYTFGLPSDLLEHNKSNKKKSSKQTASSSAAPRATPKSGGEDNELTWYKIWQVIGSYTTDANYDGTAAAMSYYNNKELSGSKRLYDPNEVIDADGNTIGNDYKNHKDKWFTARVVGKITLSGQTTKWVAFTGDRGVFAYVDTGDPSAITHWYLQKKGYKYNGSDTGMSTFEDIAKLIEKDTNATYGGTTHANEFRNNKQMKGSVKCYDPDKTLTPSSDPDNVFTADMVGKFGSGANSVNVAVSAEYGIFAYKPSVHTNKIFRVQHWYQQTKGITFDNVSLLTEAEGTGNVYTTDDGTPHGNKTVWMKTKELTGSGSQGQVLVGHDLTSGSGDNFRVKLNVPIQYTDAGGHTVILDGFVSASDINVESIPSFKTKLGVMDYVIAGKMTTVDFEADIAYIRSINSNHVTADTYVSAHQINGAYGEFSSKVTSESFKYEAEGFSTYLETCFCGCLVRVNNGEVKFSFSKANGTTYPDVGFNMADTQFYKDAVSAARVNGAESVVIGVAVDSNPGTANLTLNPGQTAKAGGSYYNDQGRSVSIPSKKYIKARDLNLKEYNVVNPQSTDRFIDTPSGFDGIKHLTIGAVSIVEDDITVGGFYDSSVNPTVGYTEFETMKDKILDAYDAGHWFGFTVTVNYYGTRTQKKYKMKFANTSGNI